MRKNSWSKKSKIKFFKFFVFVFLFLLIVILILCDSSLFSRYLIINKVVDDLRFDKLYLFINFFDEYKNKD